MSKDFSELCEIINEWFADVEQVKKTWEVIRALNPDFEQVSAESWQIKEASLWHHGETRPREANELERWLMVSPPMSKTANSLTIDHYTDWNEYILEKGVYADFNEGDLLKPQENESLIDFVLRLAQEIENTGWGKKKQERALKSFLHFLRDSNKQEEVAFIEHIIPEKNELQAGKIIRIIRPQVYPISKEIAAAIIKELAHQCAYGRPNARHHAGEALSLILICLSASRIRWPRSLESVHAIRNDALISTAEFPELLVPSIFGPHPVRISQRVAKLLQAIVNIHSKMPRSTILETSLPELRKTLRSAIHKVNPPPEIGEITFVTFLSHPHHFGENIR